MKISKSQLRKMIMQEIRISIAQQAPVEEELGSAQTYVTAKPTSYIASHDATMGQISEDDGEEGPDIDSVYTDYNLEESTFTLTNKGLRALIQKEVDELIEIKDGDLNPHKEKIRKRKIRKVKRPYGPGSISKKDLPPYDVPEHEMEDLEADYWEREEEDVVEEKKKKNWMKDIKSTGECTPYTKPGCKGRARAYAKRAQQGDIHKDNLKKGKNPHGPG